MDFRLLGPLEAIDERGPVPLGGSRQRALLALLVIHANEALSSDRIVEELWGEEPPATPAKTLQMLVSRLRRALRGGDALLTRGHGYELRIDRECIDAERFARMAQEGADELRDGDPQRAAAALRTALALWRGSALADLTCHPFAQREAARLEDARAVAQERLIDAELALGGHAEVVGPLRELIAAHPYREHLHAQLMLALYRAARQADALQTYQDARRLLVEDLGIEPGARLRELERAILTQDAALALAVPPQGRAPPQLDAPPARKVVTVLFAGLQALPGRTDPEAHHRAMARCRAAAREALERHGGTVVAYPGDVLLAVFGLPRLHEDDAARALRAAADARAAVGTAARAHIGLATGELLDPGHGPAEEVAAGPVVDRARRLQEAAAPGEVLLDEATRRRTRRAIRTRPVGERSTRDGSLVAFALAGADAPQARSQAPLVGRDQPLAALRQILDRAVADDACHLVTVLGAAGVGKSRLVGEFTQGVSDRAVVLHGRCPPDSEGITYHPLAEIVAQAAGAPAGPRALAALRERLAGQPDAEAIVGGVADALDLGAAGGTTAERIAWSVRRLLETLSRPQPLVVVLDDLQWAEPTLLELVEHVAELARGRPLVLLCVARAELLDTRPAWGSGKLNATAILLEPLGPQDTTRLLGHLLAGPPLEEPLAQRIAAATEGNPLFAEELLAELRDAGQLQARAGRWVADAAALPVPETIHALLAARLERLPGDERALISAAAVEGTVFHSEALAALHPDGAVVRRGLLGLVRRDLVRPGASDSETMRFRHALIRDAAYRSLVKGDRARLHEHLAGWLDRRGSDGALERDELVGFHLEQACRTRVDLGDDGTDLARRAAARLGAAAQRALARDDRPAAIGLLERAVALPAVGDPVRAPLVPELAAALIEAGRLDDAAAALAAPVPGDDPVAAAHHELERALLDVHRGAPDAPAGAVAAIEAATRVFRRGGDEAGLCRATAARAWLHWIDAHAWAAADGCERAAAHARRAGAEHERIELLRWIASAQFFGPTPVPAAIARCQAIHDEIADHPAAVAGVLQPLAGLHAMAGWFEEARELLSRSDALHAELGDTLTYAVSHHAAIVALLAGDPAAAERGLLEGYRLLERMGDRDLRSTTAAFLGQALLAQGLPQDADRYALAAAELALDDDLLTQIMWRGVRARALAASGDQEAAERLAREGVELAARTDFVNQAADAWLDLARVLGPVPGRDADARHALAQAVARYTQKGNVVARTRALAEVVVPEAL